MTNGEEPICPKCGYPLHKGAHGPHPGEDDDAKQNDEGSQNESLVPGAAPESAPLVDEDGYTAAERALVEQWLPLEKPEPDIPMEERRDCELEVAEMQSLLDAFEATVPLDELFAITDLEPFVAAPNHPTRGPAKIALDTILPKLNTLKRETNIAPERYAGLFARYEYFSKAVGIIERESGKVRH